MLDFKIREIFLTDIRDRGQFNFPIFREVHGFLMRIEFGSTGFYTGSASIFGDILSTRTAKLLRASKDHEQGLLFFALWGHCGLYITNQSATPRACRDSSSR
jgi:hypothetical protein